MIGKRTHHGFGRRAAAACALLAMAAGASLAADVHVQAAGPIGAAYVGILYGLVDPSDGSWYAGMGWDLEDSTSWTAIVDTGASACLMGMTTQELYALGGSSVPVEPGVVWQDEGFGGSADFRVTQPVQMMIADFSLMEGDTEDHSQYAAYGPIGSPEPTVRMALANDYIGGDPLGLGLDFDIIGMSVLEGRLLHVDARNFQTVRLLLIGMYASLTHPEPPAGDPRNIYLPVTMQSFFHEAQPVDVGRHPMLSVHARRGPGDEGASGMAFFDSGSPVNFVSESFAIEAGIDVTANPELTITVSGVGDGQDERPGWYVDSLAIDMVGAGDDQLVLANTAVFVIPDPYMPGDLEFILGNGVFGPGKYSTDPLELPSDSPFLEWYVDTRDPDDAQLILVLAAAMGDANVDGAVGIADLVALAENYGLSEGVTWGQADFNGDGEVGIADLVALADNYGAAGVARVPEPSAAALLAVAAAALIRRRRR